MATKRKTLIDRLAVLPEELLDDVEESLDEIEAVRSDRYRPTAEDLAAIDEGLAQLDRGEIATEKEVEAVFAKFRRG